MDLKDIAKDKAREYALSPPGGERTTAVGHTYSESGYYHGFVDGAKWEKEQILEKVIEWIRWNNDNGGCWFDGWETSFRNSVSKEK